MSNIVDQAIEQITARPNELKDLVAVPIIGAIAFIGAWSYHKDRKGAMSNREELASHFGVHDDELLDKVVAQSETKDPAMAKAYEKKQRLGSRRLMTGGLVLTAATLALHPTAEVTTPNSDSHIAIALDSSFSMSHTHDMKDHSTRFQSAVNGIDQAGYAGEMSVIQFAHNTATPIPLGPKNQSLIENLTPEDGGKIDPNGADAVAGMGAATSQLPNQTNKPNQLDGEVILISDGVLGPNNSSTDIANEVGTLTAEGVDVKVIIPGTSPAKYNYGGASYPSNIQQNIFTSFGNSLITTQSSEGIAKAIQLEVTKAGSTKHNETWYPPYIVGAALIFAGYRKYGRKVRKVTV